MAHFENTVAIVTGGASGIGKAISEALGQRGATVIVADINDEGARTVSEGIITSGGRAHAVRLDVSNDSEVQELVHKTAAEHDKLDFMFNNAGYAIGAEMFDVDAEQWRHIVDVNLMGTVYGTSEAYKLMVEQGFGHIVNMSSLAGILGYPTAIPYATTKAAVMSLTHSLRAEAVAHGVKISVACPGFVKTDLFNSAKVINARSEDVVPKIPFKFMEPSEAAVRILKGVERNKATIIFPFYSRVFWWLYRIHPGLVGPLSDMTISNFRAARKAFQK